MDWRGDALPTVTTSPSSGLAGPHGPMWLGEQSSHLSLWAVSTLYYRTVGLEQVPTWGGGKNVAGETLG